MNSILTYALGIAVCLFFSAFFSASEMCYSSCNALRLENLAEEGDKRAKIANYIVKHFDNALSAILIGNNLANIAGSSIATILAVEICNGSEDYTWVSTLCMTLLVIIFGETVPKITAKKKANGFSLALSYITRAFMIILSPLVWVVVQLIKLFTFPLKGEKAGETQEEAVEELQNIIETAQDEEVLDEERTELIRSAIDFSETSASEAMTARVDVYAIDINDGFDKILKAVENSPYTRIPVYDDSIDKIIGVLYLNHFLKAITDDKNTDIRKLLMEPIYVYKTMKLPDVLSKLRKNKQHLAIVTDEYGGVLGVISMEDVLEEIVGEIWDDNDVIEDEVTACGENEFEVDGDMVISDFLDYANIREDDFDFESETLGGWTIEMIGDYPQIGQTFTYKDLTIKVLAMDGLRVEKVLVKKNENEKTEN